MELKGLAAYCTVNALYVTQKKTLWLKYCFT